MKIINNQINIVRIQEIHYFTFTYIPYNETYLSLFKVKSHSIKIILKSL